MTDTRSTTTPAGDAITGPVYNVPGLQKLVQHIHGWPADIVWLGVKLGFGLTFGVLNGLLLAMLLGAALVRVLKVIL